MEWISPKCDQVQSTAFSSDKTPEIWTSGALDSKPPSQVQLVAELKVDICGMSELDLVKIEM